MTEQEILSLRTLTNESTGLIKEYLQKIPKGYLDLDLQYLHLVRQNYLISFGFSKEMAEKLCTEHQSIEDIYANNLHLLQTHITEQQEHTSVQTCREVDKLVQDIRQSSANGLTILLGS